MSKEIGYLKDTVERQTKYCKDCNEQKDIENFYQIHTTKGKVSRYEICRDCSTKKCKEYYHKTKESRKIRTEEIRIKTRYGITLQELSNMIKKQNNLCRICSKQLNTRGEMVVDHNHNTGKVRGILCNNCNLGIGFLQDSAEVLNNAIKYLNETNSISSVDTAICSN